LVDKTGLENLVFLTEAGCLQFFLIGRKIVGVLYKSQSLFVSLDQDLPFSLSLLFKPSSPYKLTVDSD